ncbi:MAG: hypothetical protein IIW93_02180 [Bacteroidaceae bacterium]|nr:hypothetical protein [Bacteroidaceae bacterium]
MNRAKLSSVERMWLGQWGIKTASNALAQHVDEGDKTTALIQCTSSSYKTQAIFINKSVFTPLCVANRLRF